MELDGNRIHVRSLGVAVTRTEGVQLKDLPSCLTLKVIDYTRHLPAKRG